MQSIELDARLTPKDLFKANLAVLLRIVSGSLGVLIVVIILNVWLLAGSPASAKDLQSIRWVPLYAPLFPSFLFLAMYWQAHMAHRTSRVYQHPIHYEFSEKGFAASGPLFSSKGDWMLVYRVIETSDLFLVSSSAVSMYIIPKRYFASPRDVTAMRELLRACVSGKKFLRR